MVCFTQVDGYADPMVYSFKSFPIRKLIHHSSSRLKPKEEFVWREIKDASDACTPQYFAMSLIKAGGLVYVVGGVKGDEEERQTAPRVQLHLSLNSSRKLSSGE